MVQVEEFDDFFANGVPEAATPTVARGVPVRRIATADGEVLVTTAFDLLIAQCGVGRGLEGAYPSSYDDENALFTPAWQERFTGIGGDTVLPGLRASLPATQSSQRSRTMVIVDSGATTGTTTISSTARPSPR